MRRNTRRILEAQNPLPFRNATSAGLFAYARPLERRFVVFLGFGFLILSALYVYFLLSSIVHVVERQELRGQSSKASAEVASLEAKYLAHTEGITEAYARSVGFVAAQNEIFVKRPVVTLHNGF